MNEALTWMAYWWHRLTTSRYVLYLEQRVDYLERQNHALNRTIWGIKGFPTEEVQPVAMGGPVPGATGAGGQEKAARTIRGRPSWQQLRAKLEKADLKTAQDRHRERLDQLQQELIQARAKQEGGPPGKPNGSGGDNAAGT